VSGDWNSYLDSTKTRIAIEHFGMNTQQKTDETERHTARFAKLLMSSDDEKKHALQLQEDEYRLLELRLVQMERDLKASEIKLNAALKTSERIEGLFLDAGKALALLNSAGVATMLAFSQSLITNHVFDKFKPFLMWSLGLFLFGALSASMVALAVAVNVAGNTNSNTTWKREKHDLYLITQATFCFFIAAVVFMAGMYRNL
jgi:hypothetical protein